MFEKVMDSIWVVCIDRYGNEFISKNADTWQKCESWQYVIKNMPIERVREGLRLLKQQGFPELNGFRSMCIDDFVKLCPSKAELMNLVSFEKAFHNIQFQRSKKLIPETLWMMRNAERLGINRDKLMYDNESAKKVAKKLYDAMVDFVSNGGELPSVGEQKLEDKSLPSFMDIEEFTRLGNLSFEEQIAQLKRAMVQA